MIIKGLCSAGKVVEAETYFIRLEDRSIEVDFAMVNGYCEANLIEKSYELFLILSNQGNISKSSCFKLLDKLFKADGIQEAIMLLDTVMALNEGLSKIMYSKAIAAMCQDGKLEYARSLFHLFIKKGFTPDLITYTIMINTYCRMNYLQKAHELFKDMKRKGIKPDVVTYTVLLDGNLKANLRRHSLSPNLKRTRDISSILSEMQQMEITPDVVTYTVLIDSQIRAANFQGANRLFHRMVDRGLQPDAVTYSAMIFGFCIRGHMEKADKLFKEMSS
ncbi:pentatricopeptide repeat-containing protein At2g26790, mitochondrial-like [Arachis stenosperma]|uniref:pentatricopeptide repeat-containing protein At2g26790, mitochondrial-like n=1 Tax=Arachis stenosperma TaxID=217475 RepID=UPI0025AC84B0|nr:pentatricopeptide repeat-containing protein At2g26790, mitochondrial-like [Arachis stenosperma]